MIAPSVVQEIKRLLAEGKWSGRKISRMVGVSRGTVAAIARGKRPDYEAARSEEDGVSGPLGPLARCPGCGGMVHVPCRLCSLRAHTAPCRSRQRMPGTEEIAQLDLSGEHRARYEQLRRQWQREERGGRGERKKRGETRD